MLMSMKTFKNFLAEIERIDWGFSQPSKVMSVSIDEFDDVSTIIKVVKGLTLYYYNEGSTKEIGIGKRTKSSFRIHGKISLYKSGKYWAVDIAEVAKQYRGGGIGKLMYDAILTDLKLPLVSSKEQSVGGRKVWKWLAGQKKYVVWAQPSLSSKEKVGVDLDPDDFEIRGTSFSIISGGWEIKQLEDDMADEIDAVEDMKSDKEITGKEASLRISKIKKTYKVEIKDKMKAQEDVLLFCVNRKLWKFK